mmetsp:Transcript_45466/g.52340  ORF Transcript_45466/g.52340 Transcript_45466/m.52340 type:complete len:115 (-) Transcript_45466:668-1012(-)
MRMKSINENWSGEISSWLVGKIDEGCPRVRRKEKKREGNEITSINSRRKNRNHVNDHKTGPLSKPKQEELRCRKGKEQATNKKRERERTIKNVKKLKIGGGRKKHSPKIQQQKK